MPKLISPLSILYLQVITHSELIVYFMLSKLPASTSMYIRSLYSDVLCWCLLNACGTAPPIQMLFSAAKFDPPNPGGRADSGSCPCRCETLKLEQFLPVLPSSAVPALCKLYSESFSLDSSSMSSGRAWRPADSLWRTLISGFLDSFLVSDFA